MKEHDPAGIDGRLEQARAAQRQWAARPLTARLAVVSRLRRLLAERAESVITAVGSRYGRSAAQTLTTELIPLADACRFAERHARRVLAPRRFGWRGRPAWLFGIHGEVRREPFGVALILAPGNYRLLLAGVQTIQALVAGDAVLIKPAPDGGAAMVLLVELLVEAGAPAGLVSLLDEDVASAEAVIAAGVDKVVLTGSAATGRAVAAALAEPLIPATLELSGDDAVFVLADADLDQVAASIVWALTLNAGATCIAPRRIYVAAECFEPLIQRLAERLRDQPPRPVDPVVHTRAHAAIDAATAAGYRCIGSPGPRQAMTMSPVILARSESAPAALARDLFAPVASLTAVPNMDRALALDAGCEYALGAAVFGNQRTANTLAGRIDAGVVTVNDLIVPTADPRVAFGGRHASGYGATRGAEGLLEMTTTKTVLYRRGRSRPHLEPETRQDSALFTAYLRFVHGRGLSYRLCALAALITAARRRGAQK